MNSIAHEALEQQLSAIPSTKPIKSAPSREADKFVVRLPDDLRPRVKAAAEENVCSMNSLVVLALRQYLDGQQRQQLLLDALAAAVTRTSAGDLADV
ncbi:Arc family DNA-binding protein [Pseudomonas sp. CDFA 553]|nr:Arc family DNA-binding protein [Pseudomonas quasicaspiana]